MSDASEHLELLDGLLNSDMVTPDAMSLAELDGFLAGMIVCPSAVLPAEWIRQVWGEGGLNVDTVEQIEAINGLIIGRFKQMLFGLHQGFIHPIYDLNDDNSVNWSTWTGGFLRAMALRPDAWFMFGNEEAGLGGEDAHQAMFTLMKLCEYSNLPDDELFASTPELNEQVLDMAPDLIPEAILLLYGVKKEAGVPIPVSLQDQEVKAGRNDPCPCGSGKKYKKCCLPKDQEKNLEEVKAAGHNKP